MAHCEQVGGERVRQPEGGRRLPSTAHGRPAGQRCHNQVATLIRFVAREGRRGLVRAGGQLGRARSLPSNPQGTLAQGACHLYSFTSSTPALFAHEHPRPLLVAHRPPLPPTTHRRHAEPAAPPAGPCLGSLPCPSCTLAQGKTPASNFGLCCGPCACHPRRFSPCPALHVSPHTHANPCLHPLSPQHRALDPVPACPPSNACRLGMPPLRPRAPVALQPRCSPAAPLSRPWACLVWRS